MYSVNTYINIILYHIGIYNISYTKRQKPALCEVGGAGAPARGLRRAGPQHHDSDREKQFTGQFDNDYLLWVLMMMLMIKNHHHQC